MSVSELGLECFRALRFGIESGIQTTQHDIRTNQSDPVPSQRPSRPTPAAQELSPRARDILRDLVHTYIVSGRPVSSRVLSKQDRHSLSAATIRNVMADLEDMGLIEQPHTSAGRVPTEAAYRMYVGSLMQQRRLPVRERRYIDQHLKGAASDVDLLMSVSTHLLSELSHQVGVVLTPAVDGTVLRTVDFVGLQDRRVLCVVVSEGGFIDNVVIETEEPVSREELIRISNYLNEKFAGSTLAQIRNRLLALMAEEKRQVDKMLSQAIALAETAARATHERAVLMEGTRSLLDQPELADVDRVRRMLDAFADKAHLVKILNRCMASGGVRVFIGQDSELTSELDFSLVAVPYGIGSNTLGSLGVIGPSRMEYSRAFALVNYLGETLSQALTAAES